MIVKVIEDKKWEYKTVKWSEDWSKNLNTYGLEGWELVGFIPEYSYAKSSNAYSFIMKRSYMEKDI
jgi:hypothetical protein